MDIEKRYQMKFLEIGADKNSEDMVTYYVKKQGKGIYEISKKVFP